MAIYGVTATGFVRKPLNQLIEDMSEDARDEFGHDVNTNDDAILGQLIGVMANQFDELWQGAEGAYSAQTLDGAEGIYLDDVLGLQGIYRRGKQKSTGFAYLTTDGFTPNNTDLVNPTTFLSKKGVKYQPVLSTVTITNNVVGATVDYNDVVINETYSVTCVSEITGNTESISVQATSISNVYVNVIEPIYNFITGCHPSLIDLIQLTTTPGAPTVGTVYLGYNTDLEFVGLSSSILFARTPQLGLGGYEALGTRITRISIEAEDAGIVNVPVNSIQSVSPEPVGFVSVTNLTVMSQGAEVESDAEYRFRYNQIVNSTLSSTRNAIEGALLQVDGVTKVRIYENTTAVDTPEAASYSFNSVILGGISEDITNTIFERKPINVKASGSTCNTVLSSQGDATVICYTPAIEIKLSVRITYTTKSGTALTEQEQILVADSLEVYSANLDIGDTIFIGQLQSYIYNALGFDRLVFLKVELKEVTQPDASYSTTDYIPEFDEIAAVTNDNITYIRQ